METEFTTAKRKNQHIDICQSQDVETQDRFTGFSEFQFIPKALPELNWSELNCSQTFLGRNFSVPLLITGMTGGVDKGEVINQRLAVVAEHFQIPMGIGSQRLALEQESHSNIFAVKRHAPKLFLIGNIGCGQILAKDYLGDCERAVEMIDADALAIHLNVLQEAIQVEGDRDFSGIIERISHICSKLRCPIIVKEVGHGIDPEAAQMLVEAGVSAIDVGGKGGTSWSYIEGIRSNDLDLLEISKTFRDWGIPTAYAVKALAAMKMNCKIIATGGIRDGLMIAKAVALGADMIGIGLPFFRAALKSEDEVIKLLEKFIKELKITMLCTGSSTLKDLSKRLRLGHPLAP